MSLLRLDFISNLNDEIPFNGIVIFSSRRNLIRLKGVFRVKSLKFLVFHFPALTHGSRKNVITRI